ncbi:MAG: Holliday junction branch migration DNA helicase RuvB [Aureliella sp.]
MVRESLVQPEPEQPQGGEVEQDVVLRPKRIAEMVGQSDVVEVLHIAIDAARKRGEPLGHILFDGPPGLGKTTFATCIPREMGVSVQMASGPALKAPKDIVPYLTNLEDGSVLFIDEIHRLPKAVEEYLYTAMEDFRIDIVLGEGVNARTLNLQLRPFTLIGATTRAGMLSGPLRDRFQIREHLGFYSIAELTEILNRNAVKLNVTLDEDAALEISRRSRGTPRVANNRLLWVRDFALSKADGQVTLEVAKRALKMTGIDAAGLDRQDRRYIETLIRVFSGGPAGIEAIAHTMNVSSDTLVDEVEPYLLRSELIIRTSRGRCATPKGFEHVNLAPPKDRGQDLPLFPAE